VKPARRIRSGFSSLEVPLVCLAGSPATLIAALRYLLFALLGSVMYLLGAVLIYAGYGTLDIGLLSGELRPELGSWLAIALMTVGLAAKTALFPLHIWLPPAHSGAPPAASALLSALVVKGSFFLVVRLWFDLAPTIIGEMAGQILGTMGAGAIVIGGVVALGQARLKLLVAYSTVAQIGYLFLIFPLAKESSALTGGILQAISHAFAKAAMFMAAGLMAFSGTIGSLICGGSDELCRSQSLPSSWQRCRWLGCLLRVGFLQSGCCSRRRLQPGNGGGQPSFSRELFSQEDTCFAPSRPPWRIPRLRCPWRRPSQGLVNWSCWPWRSARC
jgi:Proton-conducting membrane transporter